MPDNDPDPPIFKKKRKKRKRKRNRSKQRGYKPLTGPFWCYQPAKAWKRDSPKTSKLPRNYKEYKAMKLAKLKKWYEENVGEP